MTSDAETPTFKTLRSSHRAMEKRWRQAQRELDTFKEREAREERLRVAFHMAKKANFPEPATRLFLETAAWPDAHLIEWLGSAELPVLFNRIKQVAKEVPHWHYNPENETEGE